MNKRDQLIKLRHEIAKLVKQANTLPAAIREQGIDVKIEQLKEQERQLIKTMTFEEIHAAEIMATSEAQRQQEMDAMKNRKTLVIAGSVAGLLIVSAVIVAVIYKKRKK